VLEAGLAIALLSAAMTKPLSGTLVEVHTEKPARLMVRAEQQFQTFPVAEGAVIERSSRLTGGAASSSRVPLSDLTPGEFVELEIDPEGRLTHARAVASIERARVRSASGATVTLEDGTTLTIGSVLRFVNAGGKPSATADVRPGETVLLFRHPETRNVYRFAAEPREGRHRSKRRGK